MTTTGKLFASITSVPAAFFVERYFSILIKQLTATLTKVDPAFTHTFGQVTGKCVLDTVDFILFVAFFAVCGWAISNVINFVDEQRRKKEEQK